MHSIELNKEIKRLAKKYHALKNDKGNVYWEKFETEIKPEFMRLYNADREMIQMNKNSVLIMLRLNLLFRIVPLHQFGLMIDIDVIC